MEALKEYIKQLTPGEKRLFAERCGTTIGYLRKVMSTGQPIGPELCVQIELNSGGVVDRKSLNPDSWTRIWPELSGD